MEKNESDISSLIWDTKIPFKIKINYTYLACEGEPPVYYVMVNRIHYISVYFTQIHNHFKNFISPAFTISDLWLEWRQKPIAWDVPFGVIYDLLQTGEGNLPLEVQVHYRFYPKEFLRDRMKFSLKEFYLWDLKQASCLKFEKDASNIILDLPSEDNEKMWEYYQKGDRKNFDSIFSKVWDLKKNENKRMNCKCLPVRFYLNNPKVKIQRGAMIEKGKENKTLGQFLKEVFPELFLAKSQNILKEIKFLCHGVELDFTRGKGANEIVLPREFFFGNHIFNKDYKFPTNFISTSKYNLVTFLPLSLLLQFKRYANIYFIITAILQTISIISPLDPSSAWTPLVFVLGLSIVREGMEDYNRHKSDVEMNSKCQCQVYRDGKFQKIKWADLLVGDIVLVEEMERLPADLIVVSTNLESGICYIETSSLDGEKNLKPKMAPKEIFEDLGPNLDRAVLRLEGKVVCEPPNPALHEFNGTLCLKNHKVLLGHKQLLMRGSVLKNSKWIIGISAYTGKDTKIMLNANPAKSKQSQIERITNKLILCIFCFQLFCCVISSVGSYVWMDIMGHWYAPNRYSNLVEAILMFFTYFLLDNTMIPISLIVSLEMTKLVQSYLIEKDLDLYDLEKNIHAKVFNSSINEELGQVEYIFSDKTGTLTCNKMEFKLAMIGNELYGDKSILHEKQKLAKKPTYVDRKEGVVFSFGDKKLNNLLSESTFEGSEHETFTNTDLNYQIMNSNNSKVLYTIESQSKLCLEFFKMLSTCHECVVDSDKNVDYNMLRYQGPSPDEITLVDTARHLGFIYRGSSSNNINVKWLSEEKKLDLLYLFEFNSDRKRMSVIIRDEGIIKLYCKGADNIIKSRMNNDVHQPFLNEINNKLDEFSKRGFRTLLLGFKILEEYELEEFNTAYKAAYEMPDREKLLDELTDHLERGFYLIGATAVEDKLQDDVPETIQDFIQANIKVWMLTGDKLETAENIGRSCNLIQDSFAVMKINHKEKEGLAEKMTEMVEITKDYISIKKSKAFLIEGEMLGHVLKSEEMTASFIEIVKVCETVICCRVTPKQKADVVALIKKRLNKITLAIGDGANDANMIQEAHIGIGLYGEEGMRAVQASDFAFVKFSFLWKLVLVHGKWCYIRISEMILYFFYKNMVFTICQFFFSFLCGFSGQTIYDDFYIAFYNLFFTALPLMVRAIIEQDIYYKFPVKIEAQDEDEPPFGENIYLKKYYPKLYYIGQQNILFTYKNFIFWVSEGFVHGLMVFILNALVVGPQINNQNGYNSDLWLMSISIYTCIILVVDIKLAAHTQYWTGITVFALLFTSLGLYFTYIWISDSISSFPCFKTAQMLFLSPNFYLVCVGSMLTVFAFDLIFLNFRTNQYDKTLRDIKSGAKSGLDRRETFFRNIFASKKSILAKAGEFELKKQESIY